MSEKNPHTMTLDELRDWLAGEDGWKYESGPVWQWRRYINGARVDQLDAVSDDHPHPPTLDGADSAVTEAGFKWRRLHDAWIAVYHDRDTVVEVPNTGETLEHKIADLYALALACRKAMENKA